MNVVITGANRGIGLELAKQYIRRGDQVIAAVRTPAQMPRVEGVRVLACDVSSESSVRTFAAAVTEPVHVLINNAGVRTREESLESPDVQDLVRTFQVNAVGAILMTSALLPVLRRAGSAKIASISSNLGSLTENSIGGGYGYRMSKAALNMAMRSIAADLRAEGISAVTLSPGWVRTDMGGERAPTPVTESAAGIIAVIDRLTLQQSGTFLDFRGATVAW